MATLENEAIIHIQEHMGVPHYKSFFMLTSFLECIFENDGNDDIKTCPRCQNFYGMALMYGSGVSQDIEKGLDIVAKAANQGYTKSLYNLARIYEDGDGVDVDLKKAYEFCKTAADQKYPDAVKGLSRIAKKYHSCKELSEVEKKLKND